MDRSAHACPVSSTPGPVAPSTAVQDVVTALVTLLPAREAALMERTLHHARASGYTRYTSTLVEAWRASISGLTQALCGQLLSAGTIAELTPDPVDPAAPMVAFAVLEAQRHRARGTPLHMFLGLMKYYQQAYAEVVAAEPLAPEVTVEAQRCVARFFDWLELAYVGEWERHTSTEQLAELQAQNRGLANDKNEYLTIFESVLEPVFVLDAQGHVRRWNHAAAVQVGGEDVPVGASTYGDRARPPWLLSVELRLKGLTADGFGPLALTTGQGERDYEASSRELLDVSQKFSGRVVVLHDVTDRLRALRFEASARELARQRDEQAKVAERLRTFHEELVATERMASVGQLAAGVAHEVNNPLAWTRANLATLQAFWNELGPLAQQAVAESPAARAALDGLALKLDEVEELLVDSLEGCDRVKRIVDRLSASARPGAQEAVCPVDLRRVVEDAASMMAPQVEAHAALQLDLAAGPAVPGRAGELGRLVQNLLLNAARAFDERGVVRVRTWTRDGGVFLEVADTGRGIAPEVLSRVFEPFFTTRRTGEGAGLGLFVAWGIARNHGGRLTVESRPGRGSVFLLWLPTAGS